MMAGAEAGAKEGGAGGDCVREVREQRKAVREGKRVVVGESSDARDNIAIAKQWMADWAHTNNSRGVWVRKELVNDSDVDG
ncbi:hypothetical protein QJS10_CPB21g01204 [Acorus calamus]|uniref:Uncharacterized protein n=1 Tax=Acorus calamus TaxID=4465 RepID=A0AAV9C498_ACOCL|nr:hypothetical protein QJS10_CPB21g01204 [Acorus calamus]